MIGSTQSGRIAPEPARRRRRSATTSAWPEGVRATLCRSHRAAREEEALAVGDGQGVLMGSCSAGGGPPAQLRHRGGARVAGRWCSRGPASPIRRRRVVLVMSVIAAMWSQSMPWRRPSEQRGPSPAPAPSSRVDLGGLQGVDHRRVGALQVHGKATRRPQRYPSFDAAGRITAAAPTVQVRCTPGHRRAGMRWTRSGA